MNVYEPKNKTMTEEEYTREYGNHPMYAYYYDLAGGKHYIAADRSDAPVSEKSIKITNAVGEDGTPAADYYVTFDPTRGFSEGSASSGSGNSYDNSDYIRQMYEAQKKAALSDIETAWSKNQAALNRAGAQVKDTHQTARNRSAGDAALAARNFHEVANARGLNTGTTGQAALARNVTLQNNLNTINTSEAGVLADLELQRAEAEAEYNNAIAQAEAEGDYAMAAALYQESVRVQNLLLDQQAQAWQQAFQEKQFAYQQQQDALSAQQYQEQFDYQKLLNQQQFDYQKTKDAQAAWLDQQSDLADMGKLYLQNGVMPSETMLSAMDMTAAEAQNWIDTLFQKNDGFYSTDLGYEDKRYSEWQYVFHDIKRMASNGKYEELDAYLDQTAGRMSPSQWLETVEYLSTIPRYRALVNFKY